MGDSIATDVKAQIAKYKVYVVIKRSCPFCKTAMRILQSYDIPEDSIKFYDVEGKREASEVQSLMHTLTGARTVPRVFIQGKCIGGGNETSSLHQNGQLKKMLEQAGAIVKV